jgi:tRNA pseudouridine55 synthase
MNARQKDSTASTSFHGLLVLDKPAGMTSREVVNRAQRWFPRGTRIGHAGTLDPLATGVLVLGVGTATKLLEYVQRMEKTYRAAVLLGARSDTDDADGLVERVNVERPPDERLVVECLQGFVGEFLQVPPNFSAAKVTGRRAYDLARRGGEVSLGPRQVHINGIDLIAYEYPRLEVLVRCGKGTYIRSLARDLGEQLGCGALVQTLRRTRIGPFGAEEALTPDIDAATARSRLLPLSEAVAGLPQVTLPDAELAQFCHGRAVACTCRGKSAHVEGKGTEFAVFDHTGTLKGVGVLSRNELLAPAKVLCPAISEG